MRAVRGSARAKGGRVLRGAMWLIEANVRRRLLQNGRVNAQAIVKRIKAALALSPEFGGSQDGQLHASLRATSGVQGEPKMKVVSSM
jgi:hypothetical protein